MKRCAIGTMLGLAAMLLFSACSSGGGLGDSSRSPGGTVPGEKRDGSSIEPAPGMGPAAKVGF